MASKAMPEQPAEDFRIELVLRNETKEMTSWAVMDFDPQLLGGEDHRAFTARAVRELMAGLIACRTDKRSA